MSSAPSAVPLKVFICYSRPDEAWREKLADWLQPMEREDVFQVWHDRKLEPGERWEPAIDRHLTSADLVLLLVSNDFLRSKYAYGREMRQALEQDKAGRTRVVPLIVRYCDWNSEGSPLAELQALPLNAIPIAGHPRGEDYAFTEVIRGLRQLAKTLRAQRASAASIESLGATLARSQPILELPVPALRPAWAKDAGRDGYGSYADLEIRTRHVRAVQRFRWIEPGTFWMGSPPEELEREYIEGPRHRVTLTQGFWLGDTACTQALWVAVMSSNSSRFTGDLQLPVENVSWSDVQIFLERLRGMAAGLEAGLPTEAQWEYACRAGTRSPFHFGANITPQQVNYDGNSSYAGGAKGECRHKTVPVKSLPANVWGLFQMHGNVWEWCADGLRQYSDQPIVDPEGPSIAPRALRGGSWILVGRFVRSAYRIAYAPGSRNASFGLRVCSRSIQVK